ncbi:hypothetical protein LUZ60_000571 [Juncus effusus]|nr:hypothetical protein LUZ60_000571 [Juncus effusus]
MDAKVLFSTPKSSFFPLLLSSSPFISKPKTSISVMPPQSSLFFGKTLQFQSKQPFPLQKNKTKSPFITSVVKRRKEMPFDNVIQRDKKLKLVMKIRSILVSQPDRIMSVRELGKFRKYLGLTKKRRFIAILKKFPGVFEIIEEGVYCLKFKLTPEAERVYLEEQRVKNEMEGSVITKLRKLLMMSVDKQILIEKIAHLKADLGLPTDFKDSVCPRYPQYFKLVRTDRGPVLELVHWDPQLATSAAELAAEENRIREIEERNLIIDRPPKFNRVKLPKGLSLSKGEMRKLSKFNSIGFISPYSDFSELKSGSIEKEKHACAVVHEILSLTLEKRTLVDHLTHFREEFRFSQQIRGMLIRHPELFYVSFKGDRDSVFLREAYRDSQLMEKNQLSLLKEKMRALVEISRFNKRGMNVNGGVNGGVNGDDNGEETGEDDDELSDVESGDEFDERGFEGDEWSDEDEFEEGEGGIVNLEKRKGESVNVEKIKGESEKGEPVFPDGRPRERW